MVPYCFETASQMVKQNNSSSNSNSNSNSKGAYKANRGGDHKGTGESGGRGRSTRGDTTPSRGNNQENDRRGRRKNDGNVSTEQRRCKIPNCRQMGCRFLHVCSFCHRQVIGLCPCDESLANSRAPPPPPPRAKNAKELICNFTPEDRSFVSTLLESMYKDEDGYNQDERILLIPPESKQRIQALFLKLDTNKNGWLEESDFDTEHVAHRLILAKLWQTIVEFFDFNEDGRVELTEFYGYFIVSTLYESKHRSIPSGTMAEQMYAWRRQFRETFEYKLQDVEVSNNQPLQQPPPPPSHLPIH